MKKELQKKKNYTDFFFLIKHTTYRNIFFCKVQQKLKKKFGQMKMVEKELRGYIRNSAQCPPK